MNCCRQCGQIAEYEGIAGAPPSPNGVRVRAYISSLTSHFLQAVTCLSTDSQTQTPAALILVISVDTHSQEVTLHAAQIASSAVGASSWHPASRRPFHGPWRPSTEKSQAPLPSLVASRRKPLLGHLASCRAIPKRREHPINHGTWRACALRQKKIKRPRLLKGPQFIANPPLHLAGLASSDCPPPFENGMVLASEPTSTDGFSP